MEDTKNMTLGKRILYYRKRMGMTQDQLAEQMGVSAQAVSKWEHDLSCPDVTSLPRLAEIFGISTDELLGLVSPQSQTVKEAIIDDEEDETDEARENKSPGWRTLRQFGDRYLWALYLIALGGVYLAAELLQLRADFWDICWPMSLLFFGLYWSLHNALPLGSLCALGGGYLLLVELGLVETKFVTWPMVLGLTLVLLGGSILLKRYLRPKRNRRKHSESTHRAVYGAASGKEKATRVYHTSGGFIQADYAFCSDRIVVNEVEFGGGDVDVSFGSLVVDLRNCVRATPECTLKMDVSFGSLVILVPGHFRIELEQDRFAGSCDTTGMPEPDAMPIRLHGDCAFSSLKIQYE